MLRMLLVLVLFNLLLGGWIAAEPLPPQVAARVIVQSGGTAATPAQSPPRTINPYQVHAEGSVLHASEMAAASTEAAGE